MPFRANRLVKHKDGWEVTMYFTPKTIEDLRSRNREVRDDVRRSVCTRFQQSCRRKYDGKRRPIWPGYWVNWEDLTIQELQPEAPPASQPAAPPASPVTRGSTMAKHDPRPDVGEGGCGCDCGGCDIDRHCGRRAQGCKK
ncbi:MAG TPA: hypothetical protein VFL81_01705 [Candidatus Saccharimonadales bacterium]|nr:hypothetical protein [Candidatus Saccharimonadales bacterium]